MKGMKFQSYDISGDNGTPKRKIKNNNIRDINFKKEKPWHFFFFNSSLLLPRDGIKTREYTTFIIYYMKRRRKKKLWPVVMSIMLIALSSQR
jgi:hypothetical protein